MNGRRAENVKNGRSHKIVLEGDLAEIIERRWVAREFTRDDNPWRSLSSCFILKGGVQSVISERPGQPPVGLPVL